MKNKKKLQGLRDFIYRIRVYTLKDPINKGHKIRLALNYLIWLTFIKYFDKKYKITLQNGFKSLVYPYPDHDAGEANIFTRNVDFNDNQFIRKNLNEGDFIVDVGCNIGNRTVVLADIIGGALLIDPNPTAISRAMGNLILNKVKIDNYYFVEKAVGDKVGNIHFTNHGGASTQNTVDENQIGSNSTKVMISTIDNELATINKNPSFIKIDVEGYDFKAIKGAISTLKSKKVRLIKFENNDKAIIDEIISFFMEIEWEVFALDLEGIPSKEMAVIRKGDNLFASPVLSELTY